MSFLDLYKHLLPTGKAWRITTEKYLRKFFEGLTGAPEDVKNYADVVHESIFPQTTTCLDQWEKQFSLQPSGLTEQERRDRLAATWQATGGQDPRYIQDTLQAAGFSVYLHEWWVPGTEPAVGDHTPATARDPHDYLVDVGATIEYVVECGEPLAECGETTAQAGDTVSGGTGYPLVNKIIEYKPEYTILSGNALAYSGEPDATSGEFSFAANSYKQYPLPTDVDKYAYFLYIGGGTFPNPADVPTARREEFEDLCLKICPAQQWLGMLINYT